MKRFPRTDPADRRSSPRYLVALPVRISSKSGAVSGTVQDLSPNGARIERTTLKPTEGAQLGVEFALLPGSVPLALKAEVTRLTSTGGFCVRFIELSPRVEGLFRTLLPKIATGRVTGDSEDGVPVTGELELKIGTEFHEKIAELARSEGLETSDWVRNSLEKSADDASKATTQKQRVRTKSS